MLKTSLKTKEQLIINGDIEPGHISGKMIGEVKIIEKDKFGRTVFSTTEYNDITISGSTFILGQLAKSVTPKDNQKFLFTPLSTDYNENYISQEKIIGFTVGYNGENNVGVLPVRYADQTLGGSNNIEDIPYFKTKEQLDDISTLKGEKEFATDSNGNKLSDKDQYILPKNSNYYIKRPESLSIHHIWSDGSGSYTSSVDSTNVTNYNIPISSYVEAKLYVDSMDCREYFSNKANYGLAKCAVNQIGLITGAEVVTDNTTNIYNLRLITSLNFKTRELHNYENTLTFIYRIYCL